MISNGGSSSSGGWVMACGFSGNFDCGLGGGRILEPQVLGCLDSHCPRPARRCQASFHRLFTSISANGWRGGTVPESRNCAAKQLPGDAKSGQGLAVL